MPCPGIVRNITEPSGLGVRTDGYVYEGYEIPMDYDPMISKVIVWAKDRAEAVNRMNRVLDEYKITGIKTSINFLNKIMDCPDFVNGKYDTGFIEKNMDFLIEKEVCDKNCEEMSIIAAFLEYNYYLDKLVPQTTFSNNKNK